MQLFTLISIIVFAPIVGNALVVAAIAMRKYQAEDAKMVVV